MRHLALVAILLGVALTANAQQPLPTPEQVQAAAQAIKALQTAPSTALPSAGTPNASPEALSANVMGVATLANSAGTYGWNYFDSWYCGGAASSHGSVYYMVFTDGSIIYSSDPGEAAMFASACAARSSVSVHVTSISGNAFGWDEANFAPR
ncbi:MAG: hypothetical protein HY058_22195 [Proteobacteria bacterium]|nr:hypothetical protein [Pseudomonadota bacterium]